VFCYRYVLRNLATFHAVTYAMVQDCGFEKFKEQWALNISEVFISEDKNPFVINMFDNGINVCINILKVSVFLILNFNQLDCRFKSCLIVLNCSRIQ